MSSYDVMLTYKKKGNPNQFQYNELCMEMVSSVLSSSQKPNSVIRTDIVREKEIHVDASLAGLVIFAFHNTFDTKGKKKKSHEIVKKKSPASIIATLLFVLCSCTKIEPRVVHSIEILIINKEGN